MKRGLGLLLCVLFVAPGLVPAQAAEPGDVADLLVLAQLDLSGGTSGFFRCQFDVGDPAHSHMLMQAVAETDEGSFPATRVHPLGATGTNSDGPPIEAGARVGEHHVRLDAPSDIEDPWLGTDIYTWTPRAGVHKATFAVAFWRTVRPSCNGEVDGQPVQVTFLDPAKARLYFSDDFSAVAAASAKGVASAAVGAIHLHDVEGTLNGYASEPTLVGQRHPKQLQTTAPDGTVTHGDWFIADGAAGTWRFDLQGVDVANRWPVLWLVDLPVDWHD